ncbi:alpha/beta-hydrolase [Trametes sanguinea]|nr:alpha/beta-hydrolase [Trametes sanguinea]
MSDATTPQGTSRFITFSTRSTLYTERWHVGAESPTLTVVCIHGLGGSSHIFYPTIQPLLSLLPHAHVLAYDRAGSALSPLPDHGGTPMSAAHMLADLDALLAIEAPTGPLVVVAHSAGTMLAARWLLTASPAVKRVTHVIFIGGPIAVPAPVEESEMRKRLAEVVESSGPCAILDSMLLPLLLGKTSIASRPLAVALVRTIGMHQDGVRRFNSRLRQGRRPRRRGNRLGGYSSQG